MPFAFVCLVTFVAGLVVGSFLNVCIYRLPLGRSVVYPPSSCPACGHRIRPWHNIPVISYVLLLGRCASCGGRISPVYPAVELLNALLYAGALYRFGLTAHALIVMALASSLIVAAFIDLRHRIIPNEITYPGIPAGLLLGPLAFHTGFLNSLLGVLVGGGLLFGISFLVSLVIRKESLGFGDVKLMAMVGGFLGWRSALLTIFIGSALGSVVGLGLIFSGRMDRRAYIPFGPFLVAGALVAVYFGSGITDWYFGGMPFRWR